MNELEIRRKSAAGQFIDELLHKSDQLQQSALVPPEKNEKKRRKRSSRKRLQMLSNATYEPD